MRYSTAARRLALRRTGAAIAAVVASLAVASSASAATCASGTGATPVCVVQPDNGGTLDNLGQAMLTANTAGGNQTLILLPGTYDPQGKLSAGFGLPPVKTGEHLTLVLAHSDQAAAGTNTSTIDGSFADAPHNQDLFTVQNGGSLTIEGVAFTGDNVGDTSHSGIHVLNGGTLTTYGDLLAGEQGQASVTVDSGGAATLNETTVSGGLGDNLDNFGTLTLNSVTDVNSGSGFGLTNGGTTTANNTVFGADGDGVSTHSCSSAIQTQDDLVDDDGFCTGTGTGSSFTTPASPTTNGGPTRTFVITGLPAGDPLKCPSTDVRFFVIPQSSHVPQCGTGALTSTAQQGVASSPGSGQVLDAPACTVESGSPNYSTTPATMTVLAGDAGSGLGPEPGSTADSTSGSVLIGAGANNPATTGNANPGAAVSNAETTDGSVALLNPFSVPTIDTSVSNTNTTTQLQVEATKDSTHTTVGDTSWAFDVTNWAGIAAYCH